MRHNGNIFEKWTPIDQLNSDYDVKFDVENIGISDGRLIISLILDKNESFDREFQIRWDYSDIISYSVCDETYRPDCWQFDFNKDGRFSIVKQSELLDMFKKRSPLVPNETIHFLIVGTNTIVDVLVKGYPNIVIK